jgi:glycosyltransferase involved in cell wall biosynthesis
MGDAPSDSQRADAASIPSLDLRTFAGKLEWMVNPWADVDRSGEWLLALERETAPDVVHLNMYAHAAQAFRAPTVVAGHSCVLSWWRAVKGEDAPTKYGEYRLRVQTALLNSTVAVAVSRWMSEQLQHIYSLPASPAVIENGRSWPHVRALRKEPVIFSCGRLWDEGKNLRVLDEAASLTRVPVYAAGEELGASFTAVMSLGRLSSSQIRDWLLTASVYAHPALYEPYGLAVLEAALCGCTLLLSDIPSLRELWGDAALFIDPRKPSGWAAAIELIQENEQLRTTLASRARALALTRTAVRMTHGYLHAYARAQARKAAA